MVDRLILSGLLGISLFTAGCLEEKDTVTVYPDGSGVIRLHQKYGEQMSEMITGFGDKNNPQATLDSTLFRDLAKWEGVTAWTACKAGMDGKSVVLEATGYFDDVSKLRKTEDKDSDSFTWTKNDDGGFTLTWNNSKNQENADKDVFDSPLSEEQITQFLTMAKGLKVVHELILPGTITATAGCNDHKDRSASMTTTDEDIARYFNAYLDYKKRIDSGELTKEKASAELKDKFKSMTQNMQVTCGPGNVDDEFAQFQKDYDKARADYASSDAAKKIEAAKQNSLNEQSPPAPDKAGGETK